MPKSFMQGVTQHRWAVLLCAFGIGALASILFSCGDAMFLSRVGSLHLGSAFAFSAAISVLLFLGLGQRADQDQNSTLLWKVAWFSGLLIGALIVFNSIFPKTCAVVLVIAGKQIGGALEMLLWVMVGQRFTAREARHIVPWLIVSNGVGAALGALAVGPLASALGMIAPLCLSLCFLLFVIFGSRVLSAAPDYRIRDFSSNIKSLSRHQLSGMAVLKEHPLAKWLALLVASAGVFAPMMYYLLSVSAATVYPDEAQLAGFLGSFRAYVQGASLLVQFLLAPWISKRLGVGLMLWIAPLGAVLVSLGLSLDTTLFAVVLAQALTRILDAAVQNNAEQLIQNLLPKKIRGRVAGMVGGVAKRSGVVVGGLAASLLILWMPAFKVGLIVAAMGWLWIAFLLWKRFSVLAVQELSYQRAVPRAEDNVLALRISQEQVQSMLQRHLCSDDRRYQYDALTFFYKMSEMGHVDGLAVLLQELATQVSERELLLDACYQQLIQTMPPSLESQRIAWELLSGDDLEIRDLAMRILSCSMLECDEGTKLQRFCEQQKGLAALAAKERVQKNAVLDEIVDHGDRDSFAIELRVELALALDGRSADLVEDLSEQLFRVVNKQSDARGTKMIVRSIVMAMHSLGESALYLLFQARLAELVKGWEQEESPELREAFLIASELHTGKDCRALVSLLSDSSLYLRQHAEQCLRAKGAFALEELLLATQNKRPRIRRVAFGILSELRPTGETLDALLESYLQEIERLSVEERVFHALANHQLLCMRLRERVFESVDAVLLCLQTRDGRSELGIVARRLRYAASAGALSRALEALDTLLPRAIAQIVLPALEGNARTAKLSDLNFSRGDMIRAVLGGQDSLTRDFLVHALGPEGRTKFAESIGHAAKEASEAGIDLNRLEQILWQDNVTMSVAMPNKIETIVALRESSLFAELSTLQLEEVAKVVQWRLVESGEMIMEQGRDGHCMFVVQSGVLEVFRNDKRIAQLGPGQPVGELALFGDARRRATVIAKEDSKLAMIERQAIEDLIEEVPSIALRLCQAMSRRVQNQDGSE